MHQILEGWRTMSWKVGAMTIWKSWLKSSWKRCLNDKERPNVILQDVDGNTEKNVEHGNNSDTRGIKCISEVGCSAWDVPTL